MNNRDITKVITQGRAYKSSSFLLKVFMGGEPVSRNIAVIASKKIFKTAVQRNKAKRKIKSALTVLKKQDAALFKDKNQLVTFTCFDGILKIRQSDLVSEMRYLFSKSGMLKL